MKVIIKYFTSFLIVALATSVQWAIWPIIEQAPFLLFYPAVILAALYGDGISAIIMSSLAAQYFFVPPLRTFEIIWPGDVVRQGFFILSAFMIRQITNSLLKALKKTTEEKQKTQEAELWLSTTLSSIGDAVIATDRLGNVAFMNVVAENITEWTIAEARGKQLTVVLHIINQATRERVENPVTKVIEKGGRVELAHGT